MRKTEEEILDEVTAGFYFLSKESRQVVLQAMRTFEQQESEAKMQRFIDYVEENYGLQDLSQMYDEFTQLSPPNSTPST